MTDFYVRINQRYSCSMRNIDMDVGNDDWKALDVPKLSNSGECRDWCATQPGVNGYLYVSNTKDCFAKTGDVKMMNLPVPRTITTYGGVLPCP